MGFTGAIERYDDANICTFVGELETSGLRLRHPYAVSVPDTSRAKAATRAIALRERCDKAWELRRANHRDRLSV